MRRLVEFLRGLWFGFLYRTTGREDRYCRQIRQLSEAAAQSADAARKWRDRAENAEADAVEAERAARVSAEKIADWLALRQAGRQVFGVAPPVLPEGPEPENVVSRVQARKLVNRANREFFEAEYGRLRSSPQPDKTDDSPAIEVGG